MQSDSANASQDPFTLILQSGCCIWRSPFCSFNVQFDFKYLNALMAVILKHKNFSSLLNIIFSFKPSVYYELSDIIMKLALDAILAGNLFYQLRIS